MSLVFRLKDVESGGRVLLGLTTQKIVLGGPRTAALIVSNDCNSNCVMCWYHSPLVAGELDSQDRCRKDGGRPRFMDALLCKSIIQDLHAMGTYRIILGGHGEPTLHPQFDELLDLLQRQKMASYVITNGLSIDEARAMSWKTKNAHFRFSMHAGDVDTWLRVHTSSTSEQFERISRVIRILAQSDSAHVSILHVIQKANFDRVHDMIEHAVRLGVREVQFFPVRADGALKPVVLDTEEELRLRKELLRCLRFAQSNGIRTNLRDYLATNRFTHAGVPSTTELYRNIPCYIGWIYTEFDIDGTMRPCEDSELVMGRAGERSIKDMWFSPEYSNFRHKSRRITRRRVSVEGCQCHACCMTKFNLNVYNLLHFKSIRYQEA